ncbi:MAG: hypothetical protein CMA34_03855 [Euryarchaeota archaeon]|jgi:hypothetical protein|nr:hypothetical protein [Euryarchaeota archaeon]|tara:strand:- start:734 stop:1633 length:900 start_codon:yes stop_codon:yes gene_type:complete
MADVIGVALAGIFGLGFVFGMWVVLFRRELAPIERSRAVYGHAYEEILPRSRLKKVRNMQPANELETSEEEFIDDYEETQEEIDSGLRERREWAKNNENELKEQVQVANIEGIEAAELSDEVEDEFAERLAREGAKTGDVQISLIWNNYNDLDLHVVCPSGERIFFDNRNSKCGGELDVDMNVKPASRKPVENVYWPEGKAPRGTYKVYIHHYAKHNKGFRSNKDPTEFRLLVDMEGTKKEFKGEISNGEPLRLVAEFTLAEKDVISPPPPNSKSLDIDDSLLDEFEDDSEENLTDDIL